ncbi:MAG: branched-chain amino acid ABC transporter permease [Rhodospirillales bacterium]|nr:branched-chain amino acid ABC transporter permease [Rhodospirillales bacterium]MDH3910885.1 branched-chain amino acid ABC transporter permease [Rhodospirillales bacterium]MDH3968208.1 branched-chain amino acid ABC transporter permease [Rhodospirillales bacterium]
MEVFAFSLFNGVLYGMLLFMLASGLTLIFSMMGVLNFAHASFFMLGAYLAYQISAYVGFWPGLVVAPLIVGVVGAAVERWGLRPVHKFGHVAELLFTFGLAFVIEEVVQLIWGKVPMPYDIPASMNFAAFSWQGLDYSAYRLFMLVISVAIFAALFLFIAKTRIGLIIQAALTQPNIVSALGHDVPRIFMWTFGFGCALAGLAGVIGGNVLGTEPAMAITLGPIVFVVIVIGGLGSLWGALIAALFIGIVDNLAISYDLSAYPLFAAFGVERDVAGFMQDLVRLTTASIAPVLPYFLLVLILIVRPRGLFGTRDV